MKKQMVECYFTCTTKMVTRVLNGEFYIDGCEYLEVNFSNFCTESLMSQIHPNDEWMIMLTVPSDMLNNTDTNTLKAGLNLRNGIPKEWVSTVFNLDKMIDMWNKINL